MIKQGRTPFFFRADIRSSVYVLDVPWTVLLFIAEHLILLPGFIRRLRLFLEGPFGIGNEVFIAHLAAVVTGVHWNVLASFLLL